MDSSYWVKYLTTLMLRTYSSKGFTLIELITVVVIAGILAAISAPFFTDKQFTRTVPQVESLIKLVSLKARSNAGNAYRVTLRERVIEGETQQFLRVDSVNGGNCSTTSTPDTALWNEDSTLTLYLPQKFTVSNTNFPQLCFDGRGQVIARNGVDRIIRVSVNLQKGGGFSKATSATIAVSSIGDITRATFDKNGVSLGNKL